MISYNQATPPDSPATENPYPSRFYYTKKLHFL